MEFAFFTLGSRGDEQPYAALALALKAEGRTVTVCGPENFGEFFRGLGLDYAAAPWDTREVVADPLIRRRLLQGRTYGFFRALRGEFRRHQDGLLEAWLAAARSGDVLVASTTTDEFVTLLGRALGKPVVYTELMPFTASARAAAIPFGVPSLGPLNRASHWLTRQVWWGLQRQMAAALARRLDLPMPLLSPAAAALGGGARILHGYSPALSPRPADWDEGRHWLGGAWRLERPAAQSLAGDHQDPGFAAWLEDGPPPIYLGFGSMPAYEGGDLLELAGDVAEILDLRVVLGAGWTEVPGRDCDLPEGVAVSGDCDHGWLFERCCAVVHHGGAGTTHAASASGLPQVVCPVFADQPFWAERVRRTGAGRVLPYSGLNAERLAEALESALSGSCQDAAAELAARVLAEPGAAGAARRMLEWRTGA